MTEQFYSQVYPPKESSAHVYKETFISLHKLRQFVKKKKKKKEVGNDLKAHQQKGEVIMAYSCNTTLHRNRNVRLEPEVNLGSYKKLLL